MGMLADMFGKPLQAPDPVEQVTNPALRAMARLDAGMAAYVALRGRNDQAAVDALKNTILDARKLLSDAVGA